MTNYMLGVDIGTTSTKAVLFSEKAKSSNKRILDTRFIPRI